MPRIGRIYQRALMYHVMNRGVNRARIFEDDAASYTHKFADGLTNENPYMGRFEDADRQAYAEALMSGIDEEMIRRVEGERAIGSHEFASTLKLERGRHRVKRGKPTETIAAKSGWIWNVEQVSSLYFLIGRRDACTTLSKSNRILWQ